MKLNPWKVSTFVLASALGIVVGTSAIDRASAAPAAPAAIAEENQPHMEAALELLKKARAELDLAVPDKGGHRVKAIAATDVAIEQTKLGMKWADKQ